MLLLAEGLITTFLWPGEKPGQKIANVHLPYFSEEV